MTSTLIQQTESTRSGPGLIAKRAAAHDNFFVSPHSISIALSMTYGGARERTAAQMAQALHFTLPQERLHAAFGALDLELTRRADKAVESGRAFKLNVVNALWGQRGYAFLGAYLDLLAENCGGSSISERAHESGKHDGSSCLCPARAGTPPTAGSLREPSDRHGDRPR